MTASKISTTSTAISTEADFVELLGRSNFSFLQGASHPEDMVLHAQALGYRGMALCDLNGLYGVVRMDLSVVQRVINFMKCAG